MSKRVSTILFMACIAAGLPLVGHAKGAGPPASGTVPGDVTAFTTAFEDAVRNYDVNAWARLVAEDVVMMAPNGRVVEGRQAFRSLWSRSFDGASGPNPLSLSIRGIRESGDLVALRLDYGPENAEPVGRYVWILQRSRDQGLLLEWWIFTSGAEAPES